LTIAWDAMTVGEWRAAIDRIPRSNLLQSWPYAVALRRTEGYVARFGSIHWHDRPIGVIQTQERRPFGMLHIVRIHRGPLWLEPLAGGEHIGATLSELRRLYPVRPWRRISFLPELPAGGGSHDMLVDAGFRRRPDPGYRSAGLDLSESLEVIRRRLHGKWRNALHKAERAGLDIDDDSAAENFTWLMHRYRLDKRLRGYRGPSPTLVREIWRAGLARQEGLLLTARHGGERIAGVLIFRHGLGATYLVSWSGAEGRRLSAHNLMLWRAIERLKNSGVRWFDLGGLNPEHAAGVTAFKRRMGGEEYELVGSYA
jgi:hypothetical protein